MYLCIYLIASVLRQLSPALLQHVVDPLAGGRVVRSPSGHFLCNQLHELVVGNDFHRCRLIMLIGRIHREGKYQTDRRNGVIPHDTSE